MSEVKTYAVNCKDAWLNTDGDDISGSYVKYADYMALATKLDLAERACAELAAENAGMKSTGRELLSEACKVYEKFNATISSDSSDFIDGQTLHEFQFVLDVETPATDAFLAEVRAQGVDMARNAMIDFVDGEVGPNKNVHGLIRGAEICVSIAEQLRKGGEQK